MAGEGSGMSIRDEYDLQAYQIALPALEQRGDFYIVLDNGQPYDVFADKAKAEYYAADASGLFSVIPVIVVPQPQPSTTTQIENDDWIEWGGGACKLPGNSDVEIRQRGGRVIRCKADMHTWWWRGGANDIIAYRVIENDGREG